MLSLWNIIVVGMGAPIRSQLSLPQTALPLFHLVSSVLVEKGVMNILEEELGFCKQMESSDGFGRHLLLGNTLGNYVTIGLLYFATLLPPQAFGRVGSHNF